MALPTVRDLCDYLRIEAEEASAEARALAGILRRATAIVEAWLGRPIEVQFGQTYEDEAQGEDRTPDKLLIPVYPVVEATLGIKDADGEAVAATSYDVKPLVGVIQGVNGMRFTNGPYVITCDVGLQTHPDYDRRIEPVLAGAILDVAADLYHARNPRAASESAGGGAATSYGPDVLPARLQAALQPYRLVRVV